MAPRTFWKGYLKLSLVTCPVAMTPATSEAEKVRFHTLDRKTGNRIVTRYVDSVTGKPVDEDDEAKAYERGENDYIILDDDEIDAVALESTRTIDIEQFAPRQDVAWIWYDTPHYLTPNDKMGEEAFAVIREAMAENAVVGIARLVMYRRERAVLLEPRGKGIVLWTLRYGDEVRDMEEHIVGDDGPSDPAPLKLMQDFIRNNTKPWDPSILRDPVQENLLDMIAAKKKGRKVKAPKKAPETAKPSNVVSIMDALRASMKNK